MKITAIIPNVGWCSGRNYLLARLIIYEGRKVWNCEDNAGYRNINNDEFKKKYREVPILKERSFPKSLTGIIEDGGIISDFLEEDLDKLK